MTNLIAKKPSGENSVYKAEDRAEAEKLINTIISQIRAVINPELLTITRKEDDVIIKWDGKEITTLLIREDDEIDLSLTNEQ